MTKLGGKEVKKNEMERLLKASEAQEYLSVSESTLRRLEKRGEIPVVTLNGGKRYDITDLNGFIRRHKRLSVGDASHG